MSYVIQNFYDSNKKISLTPRFKFLLILNNLEKFFVFIKINTFLNFTHKLNYFFLNYFFLFFKYFYSKQYIKNLFQINLSLIGNYTNNLTKSYIYNIFFNIYSFFKINNLTFNQNVISKTYLFNLYFYTIKTFNVKINNNFYKNIFFYFMLINPFIWYQHTSNLKIYLNFILINYNIRISRFYNGHFLRIYNY